MPSESDRADAADTETAAADLEDRLDAVERALTGSGLEVTDIGDGAAATAEREALAERLDSLAERVEELEAATQAIRGYAGAIRSVNKEVERRADLALARATDAREAARTGEDSNAGIDDTDPLDAPEPNGQEPSARMHSDREPNGPAVPTDAAVEAAIPREDPVTERTHGSDASGRARDGDGPTDADGSAGGPLERLRDAL